jgi:hypothetical protein
MVMDHTPLMVEVITVTKMEVVVITVMRMVPITVKMDPIEVVTHIEVVVVVVVEVGETTKAAMVAMIMNNHFLIHNGVDNSHQREMIGHFHLAPMRMMQIEEKVRKVRIILMNNHIILIRDHTIVK